MGWKLQDCPWLCQGLYLLYKRKCYAVVVIPHTVKLLCRFGILAILCFRVDHFMTKGGKMLSKKYKLVGIDT
ncbi:hypothetical protein SAMN05216311_12044 [Chitinophaga sp. CF418]|nr:hypothetical protein SAMN05216311_12044 [Chitinophaga sp. CF418]